ncbi:MAG: hypothetical protein K2Q18_11225 [Bdellovibrionales bacterium]|nr:hypothetical protein [Bdellovibrionales bacterium]
MKKFILAASLLALNVSFAGELQTKNGTKIFCQDKERGLNYALKVLDKKNGVAEIKVYSEGKLVQKYSNAKFFEDMEETYFGAFGKDSYIFEIIIPYQALSEAIYHDETKYDSIQCDLSK